MKLVVPMLAEAWSGHLLTFGLPSDPHLSMRWQGQRGLCPSCGFGFPARRGRDVKLRRETTGEGKTMAWREDKN